MVLRLETDLDDLHGRDYEDGFRDTSSETGCRVLVSVIIEPTFAQKDAPFPCERCNHTHECRLRRNIALFVR
jgi:hypothetical protein